jgi:hypothetical protein
MEDLFMLLNKAYDTLKRIIPRPLQIRRYFELGCEVKGLGRGHVKRIKDSIREER